MSETLIGQGITLMLAGMGTVFTFLSLLVITLNATARMIGRTPGAGGDVSDEELAAIGAAMKRHLGAP